MGSYITILGQSRCDFVQPIISHSRPRLPQAVQSMASEYANRVTRRGRRCCQAVTSWIITSCTILDRFAIRCGNLITAGHNDCIGGVSATYNAPFAVATVDNASAMGEERTDPPAVCGQLTWIHTTTICVLLSGHKAQVTCLSGYHGTEPRARTLQPLHDELLFIQILRPANPMESSAWFVQEYAW